MWLTGGIANRTISNDRPRDLLPQHVTTGAISATG